jgi:hypothetical protein
MKVVDSINVIATLYRIDQHLLLKLKWLEVEPPTLSATDWTTFRQILYSKPLYTGSHWHWKGYTNRRHQDGKRKVRQG